MAKEVTEDSLFPYPPRGGQEEMVGRIRRAAASGRALVMESGTGTGKTVCALAGTLEAALGTGIKVVYLTRTKSQQKQVVAEAAAISSRVPVVCVPMHGRSSSTCPLMRDDPELMHGTSEELSKLCSEYKKAGADGRPQCTYYENTASADVGEFVSFIRSHHPQAEELSEIFIRRGMCPYEMSKKLLPEADVIAAPYPFIFSPHVMALFLQWIGIPLSSAVIVVDEAHNLPSYLRDAMTCEYTSIALDRAEKEARDRGDPELHRGLSVTDVTGAFRECMDDALSEYLDGDDGIIPHTYLRDEMMTRLGVTSASLDAICKGLMEQGEMVIAEKKAQRKLPRSYMGSFGAFMRAWDMCDENTYVKLIVGGENPRFESYSLDPYEAAAPLRECRASVSMSGTLEPLSEYSAELGLEDSEECVFPTPFPKENLKIVYAEDVSTSFDELRTDSDAYGKLEGHTVRLIEAVGRNTAVFFPSYSMMGRFMEDGVPEMLDREVFCEVRGMPQSDLMDAVSGFRASKGSVLFCVAGGRISEGLDFPDRDLEMAILVGVPYPKPTAKQESLVRYCEYRFGNGWEHAMKTPAKRKMRQAIGRLIRSETDRGFAVILDRRAATMGLGAAPSKDPSADAAKFFAEGRHRFPEQRCGGTEARKAVAKGSRD